MTIQVYWRSKTVVVDWPLVDLNETPITNATVTGTVDQPDGVDAAMTVTQVGNIVRATFDPSQEGRHAFRLVATGTADDAEEGEFFVRPSLTGAPPIDYTSPAGQVRLLISDVDEENLVLSDPQIAAFLTMEGDSIKLAAAAALEAVARSEVLVSKVIRTQDLSTDGAKVAAELRASAAVLREQAAVDDDLADDTGGFDIVDFQYPRWPPELVI